MVFHYKSVNQIDLYLPNKHSGGGEMVFDATGSQITKRYVTDKRDTSQSFLTPPICPKRQLGLLVPVEVAALEIFRVMAETKNTHIFPQVHLLQAFDIQPAWLKHKLQEHNVSEVHKASLGGSLRGDWFSWRSVDFVICDQSTKITMGIEIDDASHLESGVRHLDGIKDLIFQRAGIPLLRFLDTDISEVKAISDPIQQQAKFSTFWTDAHTQWGVRSRIAALTP